MADQHLQDLKRGRIVPQKSERAVDIYERWLEDGHPVEIARRLLVALNTEEVEQARAEHANLGEWFGIPDRYRDALERLVVALGDVRVSGIAARTYVLHEAWKHAREALDG